MCKNFACLTLFCSINASPFPHWFFQKISTNTSLWKHSLDRVLPCRLLVCNLRWVMQSLAIMKWNSGLAFRLWRMQVRLEITYLEHMYIPPFVYSKVPCTGHVWKKSTYKFLNSMHSGHLFSYSKSLVSISSMWKNWEMMVNPETYLALSLTAPGAASVVRSGNHWIWNQLGVSTGALGLYGFTMCANLIDSHSLLSSCSITWESESIVSQVPHF